MHNSLNGVRSSIVGLFLFLFCPSLAFPQSKNSVGFSIAIHGGAGVEPEKLSQSEKLLHHQALERALKKGRDILAEGGTAMDAVEQTIRILEDEPLYNAGHGAVFNSIGQHELDAAIVDGKTHQAGAVAGLTTVKNPISLARLVMTETNHVLLIGEGAEKFADEMKSHASIQRVANRYFSTDHRRKEWQEAVAKEQKEKAAERSARSPSGKGTVGCVAYDRHGNLAAGTSTGGLTNKKWGRVGSVPIVGAGTFADNETLAVSCTGIGEHFMRNSVGFHLHALMKFRGLSLQQAIDEMLNRVLEPDVGGVISINAIGEIVMACNTPGMARASADASGKMIIQLER
jgi:L-asparaginase / beta-aspartyl-peptidase